MKDKKKLKELIKSLCRWLKELGFSGIKQRIKKIVGDEFIEKCRKACADLKKRFLELWSSNRPLAILFLAVLAVVLLVMLALLFWLSMKYAPESIKRPIECKIERLFEPAEMRKYGDNFYDCGNCPEMVVLPPGSFMMGSPPEEEGREDDERKRHKVTIDYPFAAGVYEVTFSEWDYCEQQGGCGGYRPDDRRWGRESQPVIRVSWKDAKAYVEWLSQKTCKPYRLLTEAEWEYAARAGTTTPFHFGTTISTNQANYNGNYIYGSGTKGRYHGKPIAVGLLPPNKFGLHDMHGNVREWVEDCWNDSYIGAPDDGSAWIERGNCKQRVMRGGSWRDEPDDLRSADRKNNPVGNRRDFYGFRVARELTP